MQRTVSIWSALFLLVSSTQAAESSWVEKSNAHAQVVLAAFAELSPEGAGNLGVDGLDEEITDLSPGIQERTKRIITEVVAELERRLADETDLKVRQDLGILIKSAKDTLHTQELEEKHMLPYLNVSQNIFGGLRAIIDEQNSRDRYPAAVVRMEKYAGITDGYEPFTEEIESMVHF